MSSVWFVEMLKLTLHFHSSHVAKKNVSRQKKRKKPKDASGAISGISLTHFLFISAAPPPDGAELQPPSRRRT